MKIIKQSCLASPEPPLTQFSLAAAPWSPRHLLATACLNLTLTSSTPITSATTLVGPLILSICYQRCQGLRWAWSSPRRHHRRPLLVAGASSAPPAVSSAPASNPVVKEIQDLECSVADISARLSHIESHPPPPPSPAATLPPVFPYGLPGYSTTTLSVPAVPPTVPPHTTLHPTTAPLPIHQICMPHYPSPIPSFAMPSAGVPALTAAGAFVFTTGPIFTAVANGGGPGLGGPSNQYVQGVGFSRGMSVDNQLPFGVRPQFLAFPRPARLRTWAFQRPQSPA
jgi:hypothetical protein